MGRNLSLLLKRELLNLDKDPDSKNSSMKGIKSYIKNLDSSAIPFFLSQISNTKQTESTPTEYTISLYEVLARVHGPKIIPQIDNIMSSIIKTLKCCPPSFSLHQACSKVVPTIATHAVDPATPDHNKRKIIHSLCKPLSDSLLSNQDSLSSGAALCLKALVDSDNWRFASSQTVNEVCQRVVGALEKCLTTNAHMGLVMSLAERDGLIVEAYARLLVRSGVKIVNVAGLEGNSHKRLMAIQMISFLMKSLDYKCLMSELGFIIEEMKKCDGDDDQTTYVKGAAFEAIQTANRILSEKGSKFEKLTSAGQRGLTASPESQTMSYMLDSPYGISGLSQEVDFDGSGTPSPLRSWSFINLEHIKIFTTPRKLMKCLQDSNQSQKVKSRSSQSFMSPLLSKFDLKCDLSDSFGLDEERFYDASEHMCQEAERETKLTRWFSVMRIVCGFVVLFGITVCFLLVGDKSEEYNVVPT
ncbi:protein SINE1-like [Bidens hawaiensis]|uniref:protein SINE1-like n=1 Tax=Bidens hawaiensis TaxID=980011 RepID=UPI00404B8F14